MNYHKKASFWILISYLIYVPFNPTTFVCVGLLFPFALFGVEIYIDFVKELKILDKEDKTEDPELQELMLEHQKENLRANIDATRKQRALQDQIMTGKKTSKEDFRW